MQSVFTPKTKALLQELASTNSPTALLQDKNATKQLVSALLHIKTHAEQVDGPNSTAARAWKAAVEQQGLLALVAAAVSNSLSSLDASALRQPVMQAGQWAMSPTQSAAVRSIRGVNPQRQSA